MKKAISYFGLLLGLAQALCAANLIPCNPGFEVGTGGWRYYIRETGITTPPHYDYKFISPQALTNGAPEGWYYVRLQSDGNMGWVFEPFAVKLAPEKSYTLSVYVKGSGIARMELVTMGNQTLGSVELKPGPSWQRYTLTVKTSKNFNGWVYIRFAGNASLDLDAVQLEEGENATDYRPIKSIEVGGEANRRFHLFDAGDEGKVTVRMIAHGGQPREVSLNWEVQDHRLIAVSKGVKKINLTPGEPYNFDFPIDTKLKGGFRLALTAKDPATGDENFFPIVYAVIPKPIPCKDISKSPFCTETYLIAGYTGSYRVYYGYTSVDEFQDLMQRLGMHGSREQFWCVPQAIEKSKSTGKPVDWYDWWIDGLLKRQIQPYICLMMTTAGLNGDGGVGESDEPFSSWSKFKVPKEEAIRYQVREVVNHFKGRVKVYEIGWETESWASPENFAKVARWMADEARKNDPSAKVVGVVPSLDPTWADPAKRAQSWLGRTLPLAKGVFDGFTAHLYYASDASQAEYAVDDQPPGMPSYEEILGGMNQLLLTNGMPARTWSDTENGYGGSTMYSPYNGSMSDPNPGVIRLQAENVVRRMILGLAFGIERWHYFIFNCTANQDMAPFEWNMMPRPMAAAWAQMGQRIENAEFVAQLTAQPDVRAYLFKRDDGPCVVYWHKDCQDGAKLNMVLPSSGWTAEDIMGNPVNLHKPWYQRFFCNKTSLPLSSSAVYLFGSGLTEDVLRKAFAEAIVEGVKPRVKLSRIFSGSGLPVDLVVSANTFGGITKDVLYGALSSEKVNLCPAVDAYVFDLGKANSAAIAWSKTMEGLKLDIALDEAKTEIRDVYSRVMPKTAQEGVIKNIPLGAQPVIISGRGIGMAAMKKAIAESQVIGPPMFQVGRLSMANPKPGEPAAFVVPIRNDGTKPLSGKVQLKGAPAEWGMPETATFENIGRSEVQLVYFTPKTLPKLVEGIKLEGNVELSSGEKAVVAPRIINIARCPKGPAPKLDGDLKSEEWASANWFVVARKEQIAFGADQWKDPEDGAMKVRLLRGEQLYLGIQVKDNLVKNTAIPAQLYLEDAVEVWLEAEPDQDLFSATANPKHTGVVTFAARGDVEKAKRIVTTAALYQISDLYSCQAEFRKTETGYILELMIPLNQQKVLPGTVIGFDIGFDDADQYQRKCQMIWSGYDRNSHDPSRYGFLIFE